MRVERMGMVGTVAGVVLGGFVAVGGCEGSDPGTGVAEQGELHGRRPDFMADGTAMRAALRTRRALAPEG